MSFAEKYNRKGLFTVDTKDFEYVALSDLYYKSPKQSIFTLRAIYISTAGKFGKAPVFATDDCLVNIPKHLTKVCEEILADDESIALINNGYVGFIIREYTDKTHNRLCYTVDFVDIGSTDDLPF